MVFVHNLIQEVVDIQFRTGINDRLKNINELFMGTGLGRDGYSVIGQGKVSEIVESGGSKRREVFEEGGESERLCRSYYDAAGNDSGWCYLVIG